MRQPSRRIPQLPKPKPSLMGWLVLTVLATSLLYFAYSMFVAAPWLSAAVVFVLLVTMLISSRTIKRRLAALASQRAGESICEFARSFDTRTIDTRVIRAVYEELQKELHNIHPSFPIRASDFLLEDLLLDPDDLDLTLGPDIAKRTGRSLMYTSENPYFDKVRTVSDLVMFFDAQPRESAT
jgi:hypothetical protein